MSDLSDLPKANPAVLTSDLQPLTSVSGGESEIRTHEADLRPLAFEASAFNLSAISPYSEAGCQISDARLARFAECKSFYLNFRRRPDVGSRIKLDLASRNPSILTSHF